MNTQSKDATPLIPDDIRPQARSILANFFGAEAELESNVAALIADIISFAMAAERYRAADLASSVSQALAEKIWGQPS